jgi:septum formation protein
MRIVLASSSPRRREILNLIGLKDFEIIPPKADEVKVSKPNDVKFNALVKAKFVADLFKKQRQNVLIIASDTAVFLKNKFLGKPSSVEEAKSMLRNLSGNWHTVYTSLAVLKLNESGKVEKRLRLYSTRVKFKKLTEREIDWYISTGEPLDKAGAYGIQGYGAIFIEKLVGDYFTVMGLPANGLYETLKELLGEGKVLELLK